MSDHRPTPAGRGPRGSFGYIGLAFVVIGVAILIGLGVWQLERKVENVHMLAGIAALQGAPPQPLGAILHRFDGHPDSLDFNRVETPCPALFAGPSVRLYSLTDAGPGWRTIVACPVSGGPYGSILVDRGFTPQDPSQTRPPALVVTGPVNTVPVIGVLRRAPAPNFADPKHRMGEGDWFGRDLPGMASALHAANPAPVFLILESPAAGPGAPPGGPKPVPLPVEVRDNLQYAFTWFGLAAALIGVYIATQVARRRKA